MTLVTDLLPRLMMPAALLVSTHDWWAGAEGCVP